jgi:hypothetical protein
MQGDQPISWLMFFTLGAGIFVAAGLFLNFLRSRHNREIAALALEGNGRGGPSIAPSGALPELAGLLVVALIAMGLLTAGYESHGSSQFAAGSATPVPTAPSNRDRGTNRRRRRGRDTTGGADQEPAVQPRARPAQRADFVTDRRRSRERRSSGSGVTALYPPATN